MSLIRLCLLFVILVQYTQFQGCESRGEAKNRRTSQLSSYNGRTREVGKSHGRSTRLPSTHSIRCTGNRRSCQKHQKAQRLLAKLHRSCKKKMARCIKKRDRKCKGRKKLRCFRRKTRKCEKKNQRCTNKGPWPRIPTTPSPNNKTPPKNTSTTPPPPPKKDEKEKCESMDECKEGLCCARYHDHKICKPMVQQGQICPKSFDRRRSPQRYQQCPCAPGLHCAAPTQLGGAPPRRHFTCQVVT